MRVLLALIGRAMAFKENGLYLILLYCIMERLWGHALIARIVRDGIFTDKDIRLCIRMKTCPLPSSDLCILNTN